MLIDEKTMNAVKIFIQLTALNQAVQELPSEIQEQLRRRTNEILQME